MGALQRKSYFPCAQCTRQCSDCTRQSTMAVRAPLLSIGNRPPPLSLSSLSLLSLAPSPRAQNQGARGPPSSIFPGDKTASFSRIEVLLLEIETSALDRLANGGGRATGPLGHRANVSASVFFVVAPPALSLSL